jgi:transcription initiation factor TFIIH subunit 2
MFLQDLKPTRFLCVLKLLELFVHEFFDLNPISQLGILTTKLKRSEQVSALAGNQKKHIEVNLNFIIKKSKIILNIPRHYNK